MSKISTTPRFNNDFLSFTLIERSEIRILKNLIKRNPIPPDDLKWKILHQFDNDYTEGFVGALYINVIDRLVYEYNISNGDITFTNCRGHKYRGKNYSDTNRH